MGRSSTLLLLVLVGCTRAHGVEGGFPIVVEATTFSLAECEEQMENALDGLPDNLACTGLYSDFESKKVAAGNLEFEPANKLWSDGSDKTRWLRLPKGEKIDTSDMRNWQFPVGTKLWKEFRANGKRAETRFYLKTREDRWNKTTYVWDSDEVERNDDGGKFPVNGVMYEFPTARDCNDCHDGSADQVLGFEAVSLGLNREGVTLTKLVDDDLLSDPPERTELEIGDDGTGKAAEALGWLHINCGAACHNDGISSSAEETDLRMKLSLDELDGSSPVDTEAYRNLVGQMAKTTQWADRMRIIPGDAENSLLYELVTTRLGVDGNRQMPPLATRIVPEQYTDLIRDWINAMEPMESEEQIGPE